MRDTYYVLQNIASSTGWTPGTGALTGSITSSVWEPYRDSGGQSAVMLSYVVANAGTPVIRVQGQTSQSDAWQTLVEFNPLTLTPAAPSGVVSNILAMPRMRVQVDGTGATLVEMTLTE